MHQQRTIERRTLVVLGDQTSNVSVLLNKLFLGVPQSAAQTEFVRDASTALRAQADRLRPFQREHLPEFKNLHDIARIYGQAHGVCHPSINSVVLCVTQLLQLFRHFESHGRCPEPDHHTSTVGLCTGSLVAAAYAASSSVDELKLLAVPTVSLAFQMGLQAATASNMLFEQGTPLGSWSIAIPNMTEDEASSALTIYDASGHLSLRHRCFVSAVGLKSVTITGTPPALTSFANSLTASQPNKKIITLPIFAAYHASHIHPFLDFSSFLDRCGIDASLFASFKPVHTFLSPLSGKSVAATDALQLFRTAVLETLQAPLRLDNIIEEFAAAIRESNSSTVTVDVVGPTTIAESLVSAFQTRTTADISTRDLVASVAPNELRSNPSFSNAPLAIVGMSGRFPDADSAEALWTLLCEGKDAHREVPKDRFDAKTHVDPHGKERNTSWTPYGCFINRPGEFDPRFFNMSPKEAMQTDPMQRLALVTAYEALEQAGFVPDRTRSSALDRVGTFYGQTSDDYREVNASQDIGTYFITGGIRAFGPGRINYFFKFSGPSYSVDTACSSSLAAIQLACTAIWAGECDTAVAGGLSVLTSPDLFSGLSRGQFLSKTGSCKTFDNSADGYCRADGIGTVVLKRLTDAQMDRDKVLAVILGAKTNHSAQAISITHPHAETQSNLYRQILQQAGVHPHDVGYIEMHGTGTQAGDGTEMHSVAEVFATTISPRAKGNPLYIGAVKANIGHGEASSGVVSLIKAMMILKNAQIPPHVGIKDKMNVGFPDLQARNVRIPMKITPFPMRTEQKRTMLINNFSAAGGNTALLIQEPPVTRVEPNTEPRHVHPVTISGHTHSAMVSNLDRLIAFLTTNPNTSPLDLSYTTTARRRHHAYRVTVVDSSTATILEALERKRKALTTQATRKHADSVVFTFTGQGAAYPALAREIYSTSTQFRADIIHFDGIARQQGFPSFLPMIDGSVTDLASLSPVQTQTGLICIQMALARLWSSFGIKPAAVIGHSLGEYAALQVAGVLSISDAILLVGSRARLLESRCEMNAYAMLAVAESESVIQSVTPLITSQVDLACSNAPRETVYAGPRMVIDSLEQKLAEYKIRSTKLRVPYAFHSAQVELILDDFEEVASVVNMGTPHTTIISPTHGKVLTPDDRIDAKYLRKHFRHTVQFAGAMRNARDSGVVKETTTLIEIGPHPICSGMVRGTLGDQTNTLATLRCKENPWTAIVGSLASLHDSGFKVNWSEYQRDFEKACRLIHLPAYAFDNKNFWIDYRNDWTLRKGDPLPATGPSKDNADDNKLAPRMISSSVQRVVKENFNCKQPVLIFETELSQPAMYTAVSGHQVNGSSLCPSSLYADIALTIARHVQQHPESGFELKGHDVCDMEVQQPLIINPVRERETKVLRVTAKLDRQSQRLELTYTSVSPAAKTEVQHATCHVESGRPEKWLKRWRHDTHLVIQRIADLQTANRARQVSCITNRLAYRLFANLVDYAPDFQRMTQVWMDSEGLEATATVSLETRDTDAGFCFSPYHLDGLLHLSGFIMNGNDTMNYNEAVYISHGWQSLRIAEPLRSDANYSVYVKMVPVEKTMVAGNVYVLSDGKIVAFCEGIRFQRVPRTVLDMLLPPVGSKSTTSRVAEKVVHSKTPAPYTRPIAKKVVVKATAGGISRSPPYLGVIANEIGLKENEISPTDKLTDLGVDSLMSLALAGHFASQFGISIDHGEVMGCFTIEELLASLRAKAGDDSISASDTTTDEDSADASSDGSSDAGDTDFTPPLSGAVTPFSNKQDDDVASLVRATILDETGVLPEELDAETDLGDIGVDSLMGLAILSRLRDHGVDLPTSFFLEHPTMDRIFQALSKGTRSNASASDEIPKVDETSVQTSSPVLEEKTLPTDFSAKAILLQSHTNSSGHSSLFLFPDGSGSPSAYAGLDKLNPALSVYGLVCPFLASPTSYTCGLEAATSIYLQAVFSHQPSGPYHLGGWSVGGVLAFEAARQLVEVHSQEVASLVLIDAPCPLTLPPMNERLIDFLDAIGAFSTFKEGGRGLAKADGKSRGKMLQHFDATVRNLGLYKPASILAAVSALVIWAREGVLGGQGGAVKAGTPEDPIASWILDDRKDFGPNGWENILPQDNVEIVAVDGNHFSMMRDRNVTMLSQCLQTYFSRVI